MHRDGWSQTNGWALLACYSLLLSHLITVHVPPDLVGFTTVRIELFVEDPYEVHNQAVTAGATEKEQVKERNYPMVGKRPFKRMLQSIVVDPFGHAWLIGKILE